MNRKQLEQELMLLMLDDLHNVFGMEKQGIAKYLGVSPTAINQWENQTNGIASKHFAPLKKLHKKMAEMTGFSGLKAIT